MPTDVIIAFMISLSAGLIGSMVGVGGGLVNTPYLSYLNYLPSQISSTSLIAVFSTGVSSSYFYLKKQLVAKKIAMMLVISALPGTIFGVYISNLFSLNEFRLYFAFILIGTSVYLLLRTRLLNVKNSLTHSLVENVHINPVKFLLVITFSFFSGVISSSFGVGGGIIFVPCLIILFGFNMKRAAATSQFALVFTSLSGLILFIYYGKPDYFMGSILALGSVVGGTMGSILSSRTNSDLLLKIFSITLLVISFKLIIDGSSWVSLL